MGEGLMWFTVDLDITSWDLSMCISPNREAARGMKKEEEADKWQRKKQKPSAVDELVDSKRWALHFLPWNEKKMWSNGGLLPVQQQSKRKTEH